MYLRTSIDKLPPIANRKRWSDLLNVSPMTLDAAERRGELGKPYYRGKNKLYTRKQILDYLGLEDVPASKGRVKIRQLASNTP
jgi:hypothetical protein